MELKATIIFSSNVSSIMAMNFITTKIDRGISMPNSSWGFINREGYRYKFTQAKFF